ncbi:MAG: hypothetical protein L0Y44_00415 [Phycisphaerales bacterium]|nr:hypothetical protein [Phycisphaerales bacterium]MCI0629099.1 hypothetical protein [Phycisphaerales bacterium]MCI0675699.1 hypothetical protein [Phycisphaerales bacterium]
MPPRQNNPENPKHRKGSHPHVPMLAFCVLVSLTLWMGGCGAGRLFGGMLQAHEEQKLVETPAKYAGLDNQKVAVLVDADMSTLYEHPDLLVNIASGVTTRLEKGVPAREEKGVPGIKVVPPQAVVNWQFRTPQWNALPYGQLAEHLDVDRIVHIDILEYRLNPPGNRWLWDGVCVGRIGVVERGGIDPDTFVETFDVSVKFPPVSGVGRESAAEGAVKLGLLTLFVEKSAWLFYDHLEPKYPDRYRPELHRKK